MGRGIVEKVIYGASGLVRDDGLVLFVEDVLPNEEIEFEIYKKKKNHALATLVQVLRPSPDRVDPKCPYFGTCGGCQLQHIQYDAQLALKVEWLKESLKRIGGIAYPFPIKAVAAKRPYGYRKKIILRLHKSGKIGYIGRNYDFLPITCCPIFLDTPNPLFSDIQKTLDDVGCSKEGSITVLKEDSGHFALHFRYASSLPKEAEKLHSRLSDLGYKVVITARNAAIGDPILLQIDVEGITCSFSTTVFIQNDPEQFVHVYKQVALQIASAGYGGPILDLYCGVGILSLLLAKKGFETTGIELNEHAIAFAKDSAKKNAIGKARFFSAPCEKSKNYVDVSTFGVWIVNPPRVGLSPEMIELLLEALPERVFYISCDPSTLARDLSLLRKNFEIESLHLYDMFSQTTHFETLVVLKYTQTR